MKTIFSKNYLSLVKKIKFLRKEQGISQEDFAKKLKKTQSYVSKIEAGQLRLDVLQMKKIAKILKKNIDYFIK